MSGIIIRQYWELLFGEKTQTRHLHLPTGLLVGMTRAVVPGRGKHAWWLGEWGTRVIVVENPLVFVQERQKEIVTNEAAQDFLKSRHFVQARIEIQQIWHEPLCEISHFDARSEGLANRHEYMQLWNSINTGKGQTWRDNPEVCCIQFYRTAELAAMVSLMKTQKAKAA